jgi:hypothetical protein
VKQNAAQQSDRTNVAPSGFAGLAVLDNAERYTVLYADAEVAAAMGVGGEFMNALASVVAVLQPTSNTKRVGQLASKVVEGNLVAQVRSAEFWWGILFACVPLLELVAPCAVLVANEGSFAVHSSADHRVVLRTEPACETTTWLSSSVAPRLGENENKRPPNWGMVAMLLQVTSSSGLQLSSKGPAVGRAQPKVVLMRYLKDLIDRVLALCGVWEVSQTDTVNESLNEKV